MKCSRCGTEDLEKFYKNDNAVNQQLCKSCRKNYNKERRQWLKQKAIDYKGGKCSECGYSKCRGALSFHHSQDNKEHEISSLTNNSKSWEDIVKELDKCELLCLNCHAEIHSNDIDEFQYEHGASSVRGSILKIERTCDYCGESFNRYGGGEKRNELVKYCSKECSYLASRKVDRPNKDELTELKTNNSWEAIGRLYSVSGNAVRKWAKQYGLIE